MLYRLTFPVREENFPMWVNWAGLKDGEIILQAARHFILSHSGEHVYNSMSNLIQPVSDQPTFIAIKLQ